MALVPPGCRDKWPPCKDSSVFLFRAHRPQTIAATAAALVCAMQASAASASVAGYTFAADLGTSDLLYNIANKMDALVQQQLQGTFLMWYKDRKQVSSPSLLA